MNRSANYLIAVGMLTVLSVAVFGGMFALAFSCMDTALVINDKASIASDRDSISVHGIRDRAHPSPLNGEESVVKLPDVSGGGVWSAYLTPY